MLVLDRSIQEKVLIDEGIEILVISMGRGKATLRIEAPAAMPIYRSEKPRSDRSQETPGPTAKTLTRRVDESFQVGEVLVTILRVRGNHVKLGFQAPPHINIRRDDAPPRNPGDNRRVCI